MDTLATQADIDHIKQSATDRAKYLVFLAEQLEGIKSPWAEDVYVLSEAARELRQLAGK